MQIKLCLIYKIGKIFKNSSVFVGEAVRNCRCLYEFMVTEREK